MNTKTVALSSLFGVVIFVQKLVLPAPYDKMVSVLVQISLLSLSFLIAGFMGPILSGVISGMLIASVRGGFFPLTLTFAVLYGVLVSVFNHVLGAVRSNHVSRRRLIMASTASTLLVGVASSITSIVMGVMPYSPVLIVTIIILGIIQGLIGGYVSSVIWDKYFTS